MDDIRKIDWNLLEEEIQAHQNQVDSVVGKDIVEISYNYLDAWDFELVAKLQIQPVLTVYFDNFEQVRYEIKKAFPQEKYFSGWGNIGW